MLISINPNTIIDEMISLLQDYEDYRRQHKQKYPNGAYIYDNTPYSELRDYIGQEKIEKAMGTIFYIFRDIDICSVVRIARKWYKKTNWQLCLPDSVAEKLIQFYTKKQGWL